MSRQDIKNCGFSTPEKAREAQKLGAKAKHENALRRRSMQDIAKWLGNMAIKKSTLLSAEEIEDLDTAKAINMTANEAMMLAIYQKALLGDVPSALFIRDTAGEKPKEQIEVGGLTIEEYAKKHKVKF